MDVHLCSKFLVILVTNKRTEQTSIKLTPRSLQLSNRIEYSVDYTIKLICTNSKQMFVRFHSTKIQKPATEYI